jgi:hypothetical protein
VDLEGWDLCHYRRTRWVATQPRTFDRQQFAVGRFCRCTGEEALAWVAQQIADADLAPPAYDELPPLPDLGPPLVLDDLPTALAEALRRGDRWADLTWNDEFGTTPSEAEMICHVTVPLLIALGWPPEQIAVEWARKDIALFAELRRAPEACRVVIEAKKINDGLSFAYDQAAA